MRWSKDTIARTGRGEMRGRQIRSYFTHPVQRVVDHRTGAETTDVQAVLDGDIDRFLQAGAARKQKHP